MSANRRWKRRGSGNHRRRPELLPPQSMLRPAPIAAMAVVAIGVAAGMAFVSFGDRPGTEVAGEAARSATRCFRYRPIRRPARFASCRLVFRTLPGSVLAQLSMPEAEKKRLAEKLADGSVRLAAVTIWDTVDEDGDTVDVTAAGFSQRLVIMHKPKMFFLPVQPGGSVVIKAVRDGGGGITLGVSTILGPYPMPALAVGQSVEIPAL